MGVGAVQMHARGCSAWLDGSMTIGSTGLRCSSLAQCTVQILAGEDQAAGDLAAAAREGDAELAITREDLWHAHLSQKALDIQGIIHTLEARIATAEKALLTENELPALMLQSYATAEAQAALQAASKPKAAVPEEAQAAPQTAHAAPAAAQGVSAGAPGVGSGAVPAPGAAPAAGTAQPSGTAAQGSGAAPVMPQAPTGSAQPTSPPTTSGAMPAAPPAAQATPAAAPPASATNSAALAKQQALAALAARIKQSARR